MTATQRFYFTGTDGPVVFEGADAVVSLLPEIFSDWPYAPVEGGMDVPTLTVSQRDGRFCFSSDHYDLSKSHSDPLHAACTLLAELAWSRIRAEQGLLCFHGAAIEREGSLMLFPNQRRAGKSTLTACLAALGAHVFTDDYLPLRLDKDGAMRGIANGAAPRLRRPLPKEFSQGLVRWMEHHAGPRNQQYLYLDLPDGQLAPHGETLPISTIILLDRREEGEAELEPVASSKVMRRLIRQNFSRSMNPARVLAMLNGLVETSQCLRLRYSNGEEAAAYLKAWCDANPRGATARVDPSNLPPDSHAVYTTDKAVAGDHTYQRNPSVYEAQLQEDVFVACAEGPGMHAFNGVTTGIWTLLLEPTTQEDITQTLAAAFPEQPREDLSQAVRKIIQAMLKHRLIMAV